VIKADFEYARAKKILYTNFYIKEVESMEWNVYIEDINARQMVPYNIFEHHGFLGDCISAAKMYRDNREAFTKRIRSALLYYYWSKAEWEVVLTPLIGREKGPELKIDVYDQVMLNADKFYDYVWENIAELLPRRGRPRKIVTR